MSPSKVFSYGQYEGELGAGKCGHLYLAQIVIRLLLLAVHWWEAVGYKLGIHRAPNKNLQTLRQMCQSQMCQSVCQSWALLSAVVQLETGILFGPNGSEQGIWSKNARLRNN